MPTALSLALDAYQHGAAHGRTLAQMDASPAPCPYVDPTLAASWRNGIASALALAARTAAPADHDRLAALYLAAEAAV